VTMTLANGMKLYSYQEEAVRKLAPQRSRLVGDDMGLGKTLECLVLDRLNRMQYKSTPNKKTLIVTKKSILADDTWQRHLRMVAPDAKVAVYDASKQPMTARADFAKLVDQDYDYYLIHWEGMRLTPQLRKVQWFHIIADEVHKVKNRKAVLSKEFKKLRSTFKTGASGTPAADKPHDLWSILNWLWPTYYRSYHNFVKNHCVFEDQVNHQTGNIYRAFQGPKNSVELQKQMAPWFVRRLKTDPAIGIELPDKYYTPAWVDLLPIQRKAYDQMAKSMMTWLEHEGDQVFMNSPYVISRLIRLQQFALGYMKPNDKYMTWSQQYGAVYEDWKAIPKDERGKCPVPLPPPEFLMTEPSAKLDWAMSMLEDTDQSVIFFSQFSSILTLFQRRLNEAGVTNGLFTGAMKHSERTATVQGFQNGKLQVFAGTIKAGGEGIELTKGSKMVFLDRSWEPGANTQAEDRAYRIGQKNHVEIVDCMARNTVDLGRRTQALQKKIWLQTLLGDPFSLQSAEYDLLRRAS
jgi:SNF2 family DNA or RNA helicase